MNQSNCSYCGQRKGHLFLGNKKWCDVCWDKAHTVFNTSYEELTNRRNLIKGRTATCIIRMMNTVMCFI